MNQFCMILSILFILSGFSSPLMAQRCLPGMKDVRVSGGGANGFKTTWNEQAFYFDLSVDRYTKNANRWVYGIEYLQQHTSYKHTRIPTAQFTGEGGFYFNTWTSPQKTVFLSTGISGMAGYETVNWGNKKLFDGAQLSKTESFIYGAAITIELEYYFMDDLALFLDVRERLLSNSSIGTFNFQWGIGVKYQIK